MTILAIMSIVLGLCGATVTGIKEWRTALAARVLELVSAVKEGFEKINKSAGKPSQDGCASDEARQNKEQVFAEATKELKAFKRWHWKYENIIWLPITTLLVIAIGLTVNLVWISPEHFRDVITTPSTTAIRVYQWALILTFFVNLSAALIMSFSFSRMKVNRNALTRTATTLEAIEITHQVTPIAPVLPRGGPIMRETGQGIEQGAINRLLDIDGKEELGVESPSNHRVD